MSMARSEAKQLDELAGRLMLAASILFTIAFVTIMMAHLFERFGGYAPCPLCLQQRYAYYLAVPLSIAAFFTARSEHIGITRILFAVIAVAFLINAGLGIYHSGVEWKWWEGPATCAGGAAPLEWSEGGLARQLEQMRVIRCDEAPWRLFALSFAGWNAVVSALLGGIGAFGAAQRR
jgi:disulfide bond formation protein DsbB